MKLATLLFTLLLLVAPSAEASIYDLPTEEQYKAAFSLGSDAYIYGYPLLEFNRVRTSDLRQVRMNRIMNAQELATPEARSVVAPNVDTLYSIGQLDLSRGPVIIKIPRMGKRYWVFQFVDPYTNVAGYLGSRTSGPGTWALEWRGTKSRRLPRGVKRLRVDDKKLWMIGRTSVDSNINEARRLMSHYRIGSLADLKKKKLHSPTKGSMDRPGGSLPQGIQFLGALHRALISDPPPRADRAIIERLNEVHYGTNRKIHVAGLPSAIMRGLYDGVNAAAADLPDQTRQTIFAGAVAGGGWYTPPSEIGNFGTNYQLRARVALVGLGANTPIEATYPTALTDSSGALLNGRNSYRITLPAEPPVKAFWSLTIYDQNGYLVANPDNIYAVGPTHPPLVKNGDGSVTIEISQKRTSAGNWLPAPDGNFRLGLRLYNPEKEILTGSWQPPAITPQS